MELELVDAALMGISIPSKLMPDPTEEEEVELALELAEVKDAAYEVLLELDNTDEE